MGKLVITVLCVLLAGCGEVTVAAGPPPDGEAPGGAGAGGGAVGGAGGERSSGGAPGGQGGGSAGTGGPAGQAGTGAPGGAPGGAGGWGGTPQDGGTPPPPVPCPPSDAACPAGTTCQLTSATAGLCVCPGYPAVAYCGSGCSDLQVDPKNCGTCRHACGQGQSCQGGACR